jgi:hypothetical protein
VTRTEFFDSKWWYWIGCALLAASVASCVWVILLGGNRWVVAFSAVTIGVLLDSLVDAPLIKSYREMCHSYGEMCDYYRSEIVRVERDLDRLKQDQKKEIVQ